MALNPTLRVLAPLVLLFAGSVSAECPVDPEHVKRLAEIHPDWTFIEGVIGDGREPSSLPEVARRINALTPAGTSAPSKPQDIARLLALMNAQATLEWVAAQRIAMQNPKTAAQFSMDGEVDYRNQHPHRGKQLRMLRAGLLAHPGDRFLVESMLALQSESDSGSDFFGAQLEAAVRLDPTAFHLRRSLVTFLRQAGNFEAARPHLVELLRRKKPSCGDDPRIDFAMIAIDWLHLDNGRCPELLAMLDEHEREIVRSAQIRSAAPGGSKDGSIGPGAFMATVLREELSARPDLLEPFLSAMSHALSIQSCTQAATSKTLHRP